MKVRILKSTVGSLYRVQIRTEAFTEEENRRINQQGDPEVDVGGGFGDESDIHFALPHKKVFVKNGFEFGFDQSFDPNDFDHAREYADLWAEEVQSRIFDEMQALKDNDAGSFDDESVNSMVYT